MRRQMVTTMYNKINYTNPSKILSSNENQHDVKIKPTYRLVIFMLKAVRGEHIFKIFY